MQLKQTITMILFVFFLLLLLLWTLLLNMQVKANLNEMKEFKNEASLSLGVFNLRKSELWSEISEARKDMYENRVELAKVKSLFGLENHHIVMVPMLVPGKMVHGPKPNNYKKKGEG